MQPPKEIKFTNFVMNEHDLKRVSTAGITTPVTPEWSRVHFTVPTSRDAVTAVYDWLEQNCSGMWSSYKYYESNGTGGHSFSSEYRMIVSFESVDDALLFKLRDGHLAWETGANA